MCGAVDGLKASIAKGSADCEDAEERGANSRASVVHKLQDEFSAKFRRAVEGLFQERLRRLSRSRKIAGTIHTT